MSLPPLNQVIVGGGVQLILHFKTTCLPSLASWSVNLDWNGMDSNFVTLNGYFFNTISNLVSNLGNIWAANVKNWDISPCGFLAMTAQFPLSSTLVLLNWSSKVSGLTWNPQGLRINFVKRKMSILFYLDTLYSCVFFNWNTILIPMKQTKSLKERFIVSREVLIEVNN